MNEGGSRFPALGAIPLRRAALLARGLALAGWTLACAGSDGFDPVTMDPPLRDPAHPPAIESVSLRSEGARLNGILYVAQGAGPHPLVILLHGYPGEERNLDLAQAVRRAGWNVLFFHYRGAWGSEGDFSFSHALDDVAAAVRLARSEALAQAYRIDARRVTLVGHSMGGLLALTAGRELDAVGCIASLAGPNLGALGREVAANPARAQAFARALDGWSAPIRGATGSALVGELMHAADRLDPSLHPAALARRRILLVAGARDAVTPPALHHEPLARALEEAGAPHLQTVVLPSDHAFSEQRIALAHHLVTWLQNECR